MSSVQLIHLFISCFFSGWAVLILTGCCGESKYTHVHTRTQTHRRQQTLRVECVSWIIQDGSLTSGLWQRICVQVWESIISYIPMSNCRNGGSMLCPVYFLFTPSQMLTYSQHYSHPVWCKFSIIWETKCA